MTLETSKDTWNDNPERLLHKAYTDNIGWLERYVRRNSGTVEDAADIFQESISVAWLNFREGKFRGDAQQFNAYIRQICKYKWINQLRSTARKQLSYEADLSIFEGEAETRQVEESIGQSEILRASFSAIGEKCRELLGRFYFGRQSLAQIARVMNNTEESIKTIKYRCMMRLRKAYLERHQENE